MPTTRLSANLNKVALLRNTRAVNTNAPAGAHRSGRGRAWNHGASPDGRHVRLTTCAISRVVREHWGGIPIEAIRFTACLNSFGRPVAVHAGADETGAFTPDHGWDREDAGGSPVMAELKTLGVRVSPFDPALTR
jgi:pyridoxine 5'-phosphate synthase PdxJ